MKVNVEEGNFTIKFRLGAPFTGNGTLPRKGMELALQPATLRQLLAELSSEYKFAGRFPVRLLDARSGDVSQDYGVLVNGKEYELLPERLNTGMKQGDEVEINMVMLGGG